jgi:hypothetical protein
LRERLVASAKICAQLAVGTPGAFVFTSISIGTVFWSGFCDEFLQPPVDCLSPSFLSFLLAWHSYFLRFHFLFFDLFDCFFSNGFSCCIFGLLPITATAFSVSLSAEWNTTAIYCSSGVAPASFCFVRCTLLRVHPKAGYRALSGVL